MCHSELLLCDSSHSDDVEICLGYCILIIGYIFLHISTTKKERKWSTAETMCLHTTAWHWIYWSRKENVTKAATIHNEI